MKPGAHPAPDFRTLGHGSVVVEGPLRVVVDPWRCGGRDVAADLVLVTDGRADHCSEEDVLAVGEPGPVVLAPVAVARRLARTFPETRGLVAGEAWTRAGVRVVALPAEAPVRARGFLPRGAGLTWLLESAGRRWLFLGASDALAEHEGLAPDVAFFAVGDFTTTTPEEAADAAARVRPALAVPTHWGDLSARFEAARRFLDLCRERGVAAVATMGARGAG